MIADSYLLTLASVATFLASAFGIGLSIVLAYYGAENRRWWMTAVGLIALMLVATTAMWAFDHWPDS